MYQKDFGFTDPIERSQVDTEPFNIFCKDLEIQFVKYLNLAEDIFTLNIEMPNGNVFKSEITEELSFTAELWRQNNIFKSSDIKYTWYIQDYSVTLTEGYTFLGGVRWRKLGEVSDTLHLEYDVDGVMNHKYKVIASYKNKNYSIIFDVLYNEAPIYTI